MLNAERFSLSEYGWVRTQTLAAAGYTAYDVDLGAYLPLAMFGL